MGAAYVRRLRRSANAHGSDGSLSEGAGVAAAQSSPPRSEATDEIRALARERTTENLRDLGCWPAKTCGGGTLVFLCSWQDVGGATCGGGG